MLSKAASVLSCSLVPRPFSERTWERGEATYPAEIAPTRIPDRMLVRAAASSGDILKLLGEWHNTLNTH